MTVKLISVTPDAEKHMAYCARVSNPNNQDSEKFAGLLKYCIKHQHWSIFEQAFMSLEIETTRGLAAQVLRHRSFTFQEFSQRYASTNLLNSEIELPELRRQDDKNRQNSIDDVDPFLIQKYEILMQDHFKHGMELYQNMLDEYGEIILSDPTHHNSGKTILYSDTMKFDYLRGNFDYINDYLDRTEFSIVKANDSDQNKMIIFF